MTDHDAPILSHGRRLHSWFRPNRRFALDGRAFVTDGRFFVAVDAAPDALREVPTGGDLVRGEAPAATEEAIRTRETRGCIVIGDDDAWPYQTHYLALCEDAHPGIAWRIAPSGASRMLVGFVGADVVAGVMPRRGLPGAGEKPAHAPCPGCDGTGKGEKCDACGGSGEHECTCGDEHDCPSCDGEGRIDTCSACDGSGEWKQPAPEAA